MNRVMRVCAVWAGLAMIGSSSAAAQELVLTRANVVNVVDGTITENATVTVADGLITSIDASGAIPSTGGATVIDLAGRYLAPGLMDAHVHVGSAADARRALLTGVTTMRSMGTAHYADVGMRELQRAGFAETPEYLAAGYHVRPQMAEGFFQDHPELGYLDGGAVTADEAARAVTQAIVSRGVDFVKTNATERAGLPNTDPRKQLFGESEVGAMVEVAAAAGIGVAAHAHGDAGGRAAVAAGVRSIEHGTYLSETTLRMMAERGTFLVPTIAIVRDLTLAGGDYDNAVLNIRGRHMLPRVQSMAAMAHQLGVRIVAATDTGYGPNSTTTLAHELIEFVNVGLSPLEALRAATTTAADLFGVEDRTGRIEPGLEADLIVVEHDPLKNIATVQDVLMVVSDGTVIVQRGDWPGRPAS